MLKNAIYGIHAIQSVLNRHSGTVVRLCVLEGKPSPRLAALVAEARAQGVEVKQASRAELDKMAGGGVHQGIVAVLQQQAESLATLDTLFDSGKDLFLLILDGVQDPHNLGACLRVADAAGVDAIIAPKDNAVSLTPTVRKVACGAAETVPYIQVTNLARTMKELQDRGIWIYGTAEDAPSTLFETPLKPPLALVMGAEGKGMRRLTREHCDVLINIPMLGTVDSLNVSVATGICCFEVVRQRG